MGAAPDRPRIVNGSHRNVAIASTIAGLGHARLKYALRMNRNIAFTILLAVAACKSRSSQDTPKPVEGSAAPAATTTSSSTAPAPAPAPTAPAAPAPALAADDDVKSAAAKVVEAKKLSVTWKTPSGETIDLAIENTNETVQLFASVNGGARAVVYTNKLGKRDPEREGLVLAIDVVADAPLFVQGSTKLTGKPSDDYTARMLRWNATAKKVEIAREVSWTDGPDLDFSE